MPQIKLQVIEKPPEGATVLQQQNHFGPMIRNKAEIDNSFDFLCGKCNIVLVENVPEKFLRNIFLYCNHCGAYNYIPM